MGLFSSMRRADGPARPLLAADGPESSTAPLRRETSPGGPGRARQHSTWHAAPPAKVKRSGGSLALLDVGDEVRALLVLLDACKDHLRPRHVLLRVDKVLEEVLAGPDDAGVLVGLGVGEAVIGPGLAADEAPEGGALLRVAALLAGVALGALGLEELRPLLDVTLRHVDLRLRDHHGSSAGAPPRGRGSWAAAWALEPK